MVETSLAILGPLISAFIDIFLLNHFFKENYKRRFKQINIYRVAFCVALFALAFVNSFHEGFLNMLMWIMLCCLFGIILYYDESSRKIHTFGKGLLFYTTIVLVELIGYFVLKFIVDGMHTVIISTAIYNFLNLTVTKVLNIILYFSLIRYLLGRNKLKKLSFWYYITYLLLALMSIMGTFMVISGIDHINTGWKAVVIVSYLVMIVAVDLFILVLLDSLAENIELKIQLGIFEQQEIMQERYYGSLDERYNQSLKVLHDVDKHIRIIEGLYQNGQNGEAMDYTRDISKMLLPLVPKKYVSNDILNIILNDKAEAAKKNDVEFTCHIEEMDYSFMKNSDITTIFSNLLDNALEACLKKEGGRWIQINTGSQKNILAIEVRNSIGEQPLLRNGKLISQKGRNHGIGLRNVEKVVAEYQGNMDYQIREEEFICNIIINK